MTDEATVRKAFSDQAEWCDKLGSPFTARLMRALAGQLDRATASGRRIFDWPGRVDAHGDSVPLRLAGALHALVRRDAAPDLAALYPPAPLPDEAALGAAALRTIAEHDATVSAWLDRAPQTNEVARSAAVMLALMEIARRTGLPLALYELGCSAGLNLFPDRFAHVYGEATAGDPASAVVLRPAWVGPAPTVHPVEIVSRRGVDVAPLDVTAATDRERLIAYIWADQAERLTRAEPAIALAMAEPPQLDADDAGAWIERVLAEPARSGVARVVFHTIAWQYFPEATMVRARAAIERAAAAATADAPVAWIRYELDPAAGRCALETTLWPAGEAFVLAMGDAHVRKLTAVG